MANQIINPYGTNGELPSSIGVVNDLTTGGAGKALSAEMGKMIAGMIGYEEDKFTQTIPCKTFPSAASSPIMEAGKTYQIHIKAEQALGQTQWELWARPATGTVLIKKFNSTDISVEQIETYTPSVDIYAIGCGYNDGVQNDSIQVTYTIPYGTFSTKIDGIEEDMEQVEPIINLNPVSVLDIKEDAVVLDVDGIPCRSALTNTYRWIYESSVPVMKAGKSYKINIKSGISYVPTNWQLFACSYGVKFDGSPNASYKTGIYFSNLDFIDGVEAVYAPSQDVYTIACGYVDTETLPSGKTQMDVFMRYTIETMFAESERINNIENEVLRLGELATPEAAFRDYYLLGSKNYNYGIYQQPLGIIVMGQSNADGRIPASSLPSTFTIDDGGDTITTQADLTHCRILQGHKSDNDGSIGSVTNYDYSSADFADKNISNKKWAFDHIVANAINDALGGNTDFYFIKQTQGDTGIHPKVSNPGFCADINEICAAGNTNSQLLHFRNVFQRALSINPNISIKAILWHQGEAEMNVSLPGEYYGCLCKVIYWVRGVVGNPRLPFIFGTVPTNSAQFSLIAYNDMLRVANDVNDCYIVDLGEADDWVNTVHFGSQTATRFGVEVYKIMRQNNMLAPVINPVND